MAGKRLPLPKARAAKALHPVEALASGGQADGAEAAASIESNESITGSGSIEGPGSSILAEGAASTTASESSELLEIAEALESTAAMASIETAASQETPELSDISASTTSKPPALTRAARPLDARVDEAALDLLRKPPDAPTVGHYRRSFMLDPDTLALIEELRWHLRCDKSEVVRRAVDLLAREAGLRKEP